MKELESNFLGVKAYTTTRAQAGECGIKFDST